MQKPYGIEVCQADLKNEASQSAINSSYDKVFRQAIGNQSKEITSQPVSPSQEAACHLDLSISLLSERIVDLEKRAEKLLQPEFPNVSDECNKECSAAYPSSPITNTFRELAARVNGLTQKLESIINRLE